MHLLNSVLLLAGALQTLAIAALTINVKLCILDFEAFALSAIWAFGLCIVVRAYCRGSTASAQTVFNIWKSTIQGTIIQRVLSFVSLLLVCSTRAGTLSSCVDVQS